MKNIAKKTLCAVLVVGIVALMLAGLVACSMDAPAEFEMPVGVRPSSLANRITAEQQTVIDSAMAPGATEDAKKAAVMQLYDIANSSRIEQGTSLLLQESIMGIRMSVTADSRLDLKPETYMGFVTMHGFTLKSGNSWYNEFAAEAESDNELMTQVVGMFSTMVKVNYHFDDDPDKYYFNIIKSAGTEVDCGVTRFPYSSYKLIQQATEYDYDGFKDAANVLDAPNEIYNMDFVAEIIEDGATITHEDGVYKVHFAVDPYADEALLEQWYRLPQKDMQEGGQTINKYLRYICDFEVWDNGYVKSYVADYARDAGMASGVTLDKFSYIWDEGQIMDIISDDYRLDDSPLDKAALNSVDDYIRYYANSETVKGSMPPLYIALIVIGCVVGAAIIAVIVVEVLVRCGKLPKLAAKREEKKQKRLAKKEAKKAAKQASSDDLPAE